MADHTTTDGHAHIDDPDRHIGAVEADLGYFRTKRLEPLVLHCLRRNLIGFADLLGAQHAGSVGTVTDGDRVEGRIRRVEDDLDRLVKGIAVATPFAVAGVAIEDIRRERGDYDSFFRIASPAHGGGTVHDRLTGLDRQLRGAFRLLASFTDALLATGRVSHEQLRQRREEIEAIGYRNGARITARAWLDNDFKRRLLETGREAVRELDIPPGRLGRLGVAENTEQVHNIVVCTLCSCYPTDLLGNPPWWYRTDEYKRRIVREPRSAIADMFGLRIPRHVRIRVHDSTSDIRWMVLPRKPAGTEHLSEDELADLVTPESLVGAGLPVGAERTDLSRDTPETSRSE